jgi:hypothetical protein
MTTRYSSTRLDEREELARRRVRAARHELQCAVVAIGKRIAQEHPWALPAIGFFAGLMAPLLVAGVRERVAQDDEYDRCE